MSTCDNSHPCRETGKVLPWMIQPTALINRRRMRPNKRAQRLETREQHRHSFDSRGIGPHPGRKKTLLACGRADRIFWGDVPDQAFSRSGDSHASLHCNRCGGPLSVPRHSGSKNRRWDGGLHRGRLRHDFNIKTSRVPPWERGVGSGPCGGNCGADRCGPNNRVGSDRAFCLIGIIHRRHSSGL